MCPLLTKCEKERKKDILTSPKAKFAYKMREDDNDVCVDVLFFKSIFGRG